jgi:hypothetical protein
MNKYMVACLVVITIVAVPLMVWSYPNDPPLGKTGAPGEGTCADCHQGGSGGGSITVTSSNGTKYQPGVKQKLTVTITDPNASFWGYEMTSVKTKVPSQGKGNFKPADKNSDVRKSGTKSYAAQINDFAGQTSKAVYVINWVPPAKSVGKITLYVAGVGGTGDPSGDSVYLNRLTLSPQ